MTLILELAITSGFNVIPCHDQTTDWPVCLTRAHRPIEIVKIEGQQNQTGEQDREHLSSTRHRIEHSCGLQPDLRFPSPLQIPDAHTRARVGPLSCWLAAFNPPGRTPCGPATTT